VLAGYNGPMPFKSPPPKVYPAAGAAIIAAAFTARYVAKWRRRRTMRRDGAHHGLGGGRCFIGLDLTDPTAAKPRPCDVAVLDGQMQLTFSQWAYREDGAGIIPPKALGRAFVLAVDGPQGLAGEPDATMRESERRVNAPGRTPFAFPEDERPYAGLITGSVRLFLRLVTSGSRFRLLGLDGVPPEDTTLIEAFPGGAFRKLADGQLPAKRTEEGRQARLALLQGLGLVFPDPATLPTPDQLDAAMAAWVAMRFHEGAAHAEGAAPEMDEVAGVVREGYIIMPGDPEPEGIVVPEDAVTPV
jgi:hypothetical protein